jgi:uncharacterized iron-regulated membrane protein
MSARRLLRLTHGWIGAVLALFIVLVAGTGAGLAFMSEMFLAQYGDVLRAEAPLHGAEPANIDELFAAAQATRGPGFAPIGVLMPHSRVPKAETAIVFGMERGGDPDYPMMVSVDPWTSKVKGAFSLGDAIGHDMIDFHYELTMGPLGATFTAVLGLLLVGFAATGLWLWWPRKGSAWRKARMLRLKGSASQQMFTVHGWLGVWTALLVVVFALSGTATARPEWFGPALADTDALEPSGSNWSRYCGDTVTPGQAAANARAQFPGREVASIYLVPDEPIHVQMKHAGDLDRIDGDAIFWQHTGCARVGKAADLSSASVPHQLSSMMLSLHGGYLFGPVLGPILVLVTGLSLVFFSVSGVFVFFTRTLRAKPRRTELPDFVPAE